MPYIYMKSKRGKITSFYTKNKAIKVGNVFTQNIFEKLIEIVESNLNK